MFSAADFSREFLFSRGAMNLGVAMPAPGSEEIAPREIGEARRARRLTPVMPATDVQIVYKKAIKGDGDWASLAMDDSIAPTPSLSFL